MSWCMGGTPRGDDNTRSTTVLLCDSPTRDQGSTLKGAVQMWA